MIPVWILFFFVPLKKKNTNKHIILHTYINKKQKQTAPKKQMLCMLPISLSLSLSLCYSNKMQFLSKYRFQKWHQ